MPAGAPGARHGADRRGDRRLARSEDGEPCRGPRGSADRGSARVRVRPARTLASARQALLPAPPRSRDADRQTRTERCHGAGRGSRRARHGRGAGGTPGPTRRRVRAQPWGADGGARLPASAPPPKHRPTRHPQGGQARSRSARSGVSDAPRRRTNGCPPPGRWLFCPWEQGGAADTLCRVTSPQGGQHARRHIPRSEVPPWAARPCPGPPALAVRAWTRLRRKRLDEGPARGAAPGVSAELALRAAQLRSTSERYRLASALVEAVGKARGPNLGAHRMNRRTGRRHAGVRSIVRVGTRFAGRIAARGQRAPRHPSHAHFTLLRLRTPRTAPSPGERC
jgi:hypothetical protein